MSALGPPETMAILNHLIYLAAFVLLVLVQGISGGQRGGFRGGGDLGQGGRL